MTQSFIKSISKSAKAAVVAALALVFWASGSAGAFFVRAQDKGTEAREQAIRVFYRFDSAVLDRSYLDNPSVFAKLDSLMKSVNPEDVQDLQVISYSSPEGVWEYNVGLSERRARAFAKYIQDTYPSFRGKVSIHPDGESWDDLKASIEADTRLSESERTRALRIINFEAAPDAKERALKNLPTYSYLYSGYFRRLRYAEIKLVTPAGIAAAEAGMRSMADSAEEAMAGASGVVSSLEPVPGRVYFRLKDTSVDPSYLENTATLSYIRQLLANTPADEISSIVIFSSTSPDGAAELNDKVESERAKATEEYITARYPDLAGKIEVRKSGENWTELRSLVEADDELSESSKQKILSVIDSSATPDEKEQALRELDEYEHLTEKEFPMLRYSRIEVSKSEYDTKSKGHGGFESQDDKSSAAAAASGSDRNASDASGKRGGLDPEPGRLYFRKDKTDVDRDYLDNEGALAYIDSLLSSVNPDEVESIEIRTSASPDGTVSHNDKVEARRAESVRRYIESKYPEFSDKVKETRGGENWTELRSLVEADDELSESSKQKILSVIDSSATPDEKEQALRELDEYEHLTEKEFPMLRYSRIEVSKSEYDTKSKGHGGFESQDDKSSAAAAASGSDRNASDASGKRGGLDPEPGRLYFRKDKTDVDRDYLDNEGALAYIDSLLSSVNPDEVESIEIRTSASPDGTVSHNDKVEARRAESVRRYIESKYPEFSDKVKEARGGENWPEFRKNVEDDDEMSEPLRKRILSIIDSDDSADRKEQRLRDMDEYDEVAERHFPALRYAETRITRRQKEEPKAPEAPEIPAEDIETEEVELSVEQDTLDTFVAPVDTLAAPVSEEPADTTASEPRRPVVALSTNVLYDLAITPNFAVEFPIGKKLSLYGEYTFPWWVTRDNSRAWQILKWDLGARYWFFGGRSENPMDVMIGPFAGIDLSAGYYDIEPHHKGWQGEFQMVGAELGWAWDLGRNWRLDAYVGAGWMGSHFRYYEATTGDKHLIYQHSGKLNWFGPTKAGVSVKYIFGTKDRRTVK